MANKPKTPKKPKVPRSTGVTHIGNKTLKNK